MFSSSQESSLKLKTVNKDIAVRFPAGEQFCARLPKQKTIGKNPVRGKSMHETLGARLLGSFSEIRISGDNLDDCEASEFVKLPSRQVTGAVREEASLQ